MALWYSLAAFATLALGSGFLYWELQAGLERQNQTLLADKVNVLRVVLRERPGDTNAIREEVQWESAARIFSKYFTRLTDEQNRLIMATSGMDQWVPATAPFPAPASSDNPPPPGVKWRLPGGKTFLLTAAWAALGDDPGRRYRQQIALEVTSEEMLLGAYRRKLAIVLCVGVLLSAGLGLGIARRGLRPLPDITRVARRITASALGQRISPHDWPQELAELAAEFDRMLERLEESFNRLSQFSADLAHELRTPINNLRGEAEVALSRPRAPAEYRRVLESGLEELQRLSDMIDSLLFLARAENAETRLQRVSFPAPQAMQPVCEYYEALAEEQRVALAVTSNGAVNLQADPLLVRRALSNLVSNALRHTPPGGKVTLTANPRPDGGVELRVADTGGGIAPEHQARVFDRFYRVDPARARGQSGTGLGLAIVQSIMQLHGGAVTLQSQPGQGTIVTLQFPPAAPAASSAAT